MLNLNFPKLIKERPNEKELKEKPEVNASNINFKVSSFTKAKAKDSNIQEDFVLNALRRMNFKYNLNDLDLKWYHIVNPLTFCLQSSKEIYNYDSYVKYLNKMISLESILSSVYVTKELPNMLLKDDECNAFEYLLANNKKQVELNQISISIDKMKKKGANEKLINKLNVMICHV